MVSGGLLFPSVFFGSFLLGNAKEMNKQQRLDNLLDHHQAHELAKPMIVQNVSGKDTLLFFSLKNTSLLPLFTACHQI